jgi:hypothetical protein
MVQQNENDAASPLPDRPLRPFLLLSGLLVAMVGLLIWQLPRIHQYGSRAVTFVIYVVVGLIAAVIRVVPQ